MTEFNEFELGDLVFSNEDHILLGVDAESPGIVVEVVEDFSGQVEVAVQFYPENNEVRFTPDELTIVGRNGELTTFESVTEGDRIMMLNPNTELIKVLVEDVFRANGIADIYGIDVDDPEDSFSFELPVDCDVFKVSA